MMIGIKNGKLYQTDGARHDGKGFGRAASVVEEGSVVLSDAGGLLARQQQQKTFDDLRNAKIKYINDSRKNKAHVMGMFDEAKRRQVMAIQVKPVDKQQELIKKELMRQFSGPADFQALERMKSNYDFGQRPVGPKGNRGLGSNDVDFNNSADFREYDPIGNPLTRDGSYGSVTDFERLVKGYPIGLTRGQVPGGMTQDNSSGQFGSQPSVRLRPRVRGESMNDYVRNMSGLGGKGFGDMFDDLYAAEDIAAGGGPVDEFGNPLGTVYDLSAGQVVYDSEGNVIQTGAAAPAAPSGPSFWDTLTSAATQAASNPQIQAQALKAASSLLQPGSSSSGASSVSALVPRPATTLKPTAPSMLSAQVTIPGTSMKISKGTILGILLIAGGASVYLLKRRRGKSLRTAKA